MSDTLKPFHFRTFLNDEGHWGLDAVLAEVADGELGEDRMDLNALFQLTSDGAPATLDFGVYGMAETKEQRAELRKMAENASNKAIRLARAVSMFREALDTRLDALNARLDEMDALDTRSAALDYRLDAMAAMEKGV